MKMKCIGVGFSWIAVVLAVLCTLGLALAATVALSITDPSQQSGPDAGFAFLLITSYLALTGAGALITGALGQFLGPQESSTWHKKRTWYALAIGATAVLVGLVYGIPLLS